MKYPMLDVVVADFISFLKCTTQILEIFKSIDGFFDGYSLSPHLGSFRLESSCSNGAGRVFPFAQAAGKRGL